MVNLGLIDADGGQLSTLEKGAKSRDTIAKYIPTCPASESSGEAARLCSLDRGG